MRQLVLHLSELVGRWVPYLNRASGTAGIPHELLLLTRDADCLVTDRLAKAGPPSVAQALRDAGFRPATDPTMAAVWIGDVAGGERILAA